MLDDLRIKILYRIKILEFRIQAWIKALEISKAYSHKQKPLMEKKRLMQISRTAAVYVGILIIGTGAVMGILKLIQLRPISDPEAAIVTRIPDQRSSSFSQRDSILKEVSSLSTIDSLSSNKANIVQEQLELKDIISKQENHTYPPAGYFIILANKAMKTLYLLQNNTGNWQVLRSFHMGFGAQMGRKKNAGDKRTPEGDYFIIERKEKRELASLYGPLAFVLDYPNQQDRKEGRTGQGIWIHGTDPDSSPGETKGCLEIANDNLLELASFIKDGVGTPVIIVDKPESNPVTILDFKSIDQKREIVLSQRKQFDEEFKVLLENWELAWESMNIEQYKQFYDTLGFSSQGVSWKGWRERKVRTFEIYSSIDVTIDNVLVFDHTENSVVLKFLQIYRSDKNSLENGKQLVLQKKNGSWKITREVTIPKEELLL